MSHTDAQLRELILSFVPDDGSTIGNAKLLKALSAQAGEAAAALSTSPILPSSAKTLSRTTRPPT
ncbi:MAG: hypothetical protein U5L98_03045 [Halomonas sp.]|uniref:hypothetical protein n=1 Tax=Halomonas sp. TaxID=1486246 RepID=UPI002ACD8FB3|nr:hypothetical protein [Halomonas sp.]MDZ7851639.1 hypothetical protein [Halomonas sp.]